MMKNRFTEVQIAAPAVQRYCNALAKTSRSRSALKMPCASAFVT